LTPRLSPLFLALAAVAFASLALGGCSRKPPAGQEPLVVAIAPSDAAPAAAWAPLLTDMGEAVGREAQPFFGSNDTARIEAMRYRQADLGLFDNASGLEAARRAGAEVFARAAQADGSDAYRVALLVRKDSGVTLERLLACDRTLTVGLGETAASIDSLAPMTYLFGPRRIDPQTCFKAVRTASAEANVYAVSAGVLDAATAATPAMTKVAASNRAALAKVETIWASPLIPDSPVLWRKNLDPLVKGKVEKFLFTYGTGSGRRADAQREVLKRLGLRGFVRADESHFFATREMDAAQRLRTANEQRDVAGEARARSDLDAIAAARAARLNRHSAHP
jgi:phosphonate transport system substrate-binding protein